MKILTKTEIECLKRAVEILNKKAESRSEFYSALLDAGCQPSTAIGTLNDIIQTAELLTLTSR